MFRFRIIAFLILLIGDFIPIKPIDLDIVFISYTSNLFGPYRANCANQNIDVTINTNKKIYSSYLTVYVGLSASNYSYSKEYPSFTLSANSSRTQTITLPTREYLTSNGMYIKFKFTYHAELEAPDLTMDTSYVIYPVQTETNIKPEDYITSPCTNHYVSYKFGNGTLLSYDESFQFPDYIDYFNIDTYHRLDLNSVSFIYTCNASFTYSTAYLQIYDEESIFPYINKNGDGYFLIPLKVIKEGNKHVFAFKNQFYVDPITAQMSFEPKEGFVLTRYFYLPKNGRENLLDTKMNIYLYGAGLGASNISWNPTYLASQNLLGDCSDSDYCIIGEQKNG